MKRLKNVTVIFIYFLLVEIVAHASKIIVSSINSILLLKVQGPTEFTFITETLSYFWGIGIAAFFMYRICAKKHNLIRLSDLLIFIMCMIILHTIIVFFGKWSCILWTTNGGGELVHYLYNGRKYVMSYRDIPLYYYFVVRFAQDILFLIMSVLGFVSVRKPSRNI